MKLQPARGTRDLLPQNYLEHNFLTNKAKEIATNYGFLPIETPIFEFAEIFKRSLGDYSDVVTKEMYEFTDKGGENITLRPEYTAAIVRAVISNGLTHDLPLKLFSSGPLFRYERPQKGRFRQFHQLNFESIGIASPRHDAEIIQMAVDLLKEFGIQDKVTLELNSLGDSTTRANYQNKLTEYLFDFANDLSEESKLRLHKNPLRILDSKNENDQKLLLNAPKINEFYNEESQEFKEILLQTLDALDVKYHFNPKLVRGLDYYNHTAFEFTTDLLGAQATVLGGGRYDGLFKLMGGPDTPAIGFAAGIERLALLAEFPDFTNRPTALIALTPEDEITVLKLATQLRTREVVQIIYGNNLSKKLKRANKINCKYAIIIGEEERAKSKAKKRNLDDGSEEEITI